jgi:hypothetical protein
VDNSNGRQRVNPIRSDPHRRDISFRSGGSKNRARRNIFLVISLVQPETRRCPGMKRMAFNDRIPETLFWIRLPLKIVERLYGKEYAVYDTQKCVKQELMYSFIIVHFLTGPKISYKIHARVLPFC